jgi:hypothetical protein
MKTVAVIFVSMVCLQAYSQEPRDPEQVSKENPIFQVAKHYLRSNPYNIHFSAFLNHLMNDPTLSNKTVEKRSDTSFFSFRGVYSNHNPYSFKANRTEVRLSERQVMMEDSLSTVDTLLFYQLIGYSYGAGTESVKKEFSKFDRRYGKNFYSELGEIKKGDEIVGMAKNYYFLDITVLSPLSMSWEKLDDYQSVFTITFRIKLMQNVATLPIFLDDH